MLRRRLMQSGIPKDAVDLGLPSGLLWRTHNLGGDIETDFGLYFSYGNVDGHEAGSYSFTNGNYSYTSGYGLNGDIPTNSTYDAANAMLGDRWRMPTLADSRELKENCTYAWTSNYQGSGIGGALLTSKINGKEIFFPISGYVNGTTPSRYSVYLRESTQYDTGHGYLLNITDSQFNYNFSYGDKYTGIAIRPVYNP